MAEYDTDIQSKVLELSTDALTAFCDDISGMFGVDMECAQQDIASETANGLKKRFKKLTAVNSIKAKGAFHDTFYVVFDQDGLFTLSGIVIMLPENQIKEEIKRGSEKEAEHMSDAIAELGNMMVGTWDRAFREKLPGHEHFTQTNTFIGKPWENPQEVLGVDSDEEFAFIPYDMTVGSYPTFRCGVIFPNTVFEPEPEEPESEIEDAVEDNAEDQESVEETDSDSNEAAEQGREEEDKTESAAVSDEAENADAEQIAAEDADPDGQTEAGPESDAEPGDSDGEPNGDVDDSGKDGGSSEQEHAVEEQDRPVSRAIEEMTSSVSPSVSLSATAQQIMQKNVVWVEETETVQQAANKMQQHQVGYLMAGKDGVLEGIVSRSDVAGAISPYLRPVFAKWKRPLDEATLQIKISWIMTKPVRTITPHTPLDVIVDTMLHFGGRCLPVVDEEGKVQGMVTAFDVFKVFATDKNIGQAGRTPQMPVVV